MLLTMALILAVAGTVSEVVLVHNIKWLDKLYLNGGLGVSGDVWNFIGSLFLSVAMGACFAADGVTVFLGGALGGLFSAVYFKAERGLEAAGWDRPRIKTEWEKNKALAIRYTILMFRVLKFCIKTITAPIRAADWTRKQINKIKVAAQ